MNIQNTTAIKYISAGATLSEVAIEGCQFGQWWVERDASGAARVRGNFFTADPDIAETLAALAIAGREGDSALVVYYTHDGTAKSKTFLRVLFGTGAGSYMTTKQDPGGNDLRNRIEFECSIPEGSSAADVIKSTVPTKMPPSITTQAVSSIASTGATGNGTVTYANGGTVSARGVCWSTTQNPTLADSYAAAGAGGTGAFTASITGLKPDTSYNVRAYATSESGTSYGQQVTFKTSKAEPTVTTSTTNRVGSTTATCGGYVSADNGAAVIARGVCWGTSTNPTISDRRTGNSSGLGIFTATLTGLSPSTTYHVRAYAINSEGVAYGSDVTITTSAAGGSGSTEDTTPTVTTNAIGAVRYDSGTSTFSLACGGDVTSDGGNTITARGVCYGTSPDPDTGDSKVDSATDAVGDFAVEITGLTPGDRYFFRAYATNSQGTTYGQNRYIVPQA